jgi:hypothetical protein
MRQIPANTVCVVVPGEMPTVITADGKAHEVTVDELGRRTVHIQPDDARRLINSGLPCCMPWLEANGGLAQTIGPPPKLRANKRHRRATKLLPLPIHH